MFWITVKNKSVSNHSVLIPESKGSTVLERVSKHNFLILLVLIVSILITSIVIAYFAPLASNLEQINAKRCVVNQFSKTSKLIDSENCDYYYNSLDYKQNTINILFVFELPVPREGIPMTYSRWQQNLLSILSLTVNYSDNDSISQNVMDINAESLINIKIGVKDVGDKDWKLYANEDITRNINCQLKRSEPFNGYDCVCDFIQLFDLQLLYEKYLINLLFISKVKNDNHFGQPNDLSLIVMHRNEFFTKTWLSFRCLFTGMSLISFVWFICRLFCMKRSATTLEKALVVLTCALIQFNFPIEYLCLYSDIKFMAFIRELSLALFYWILFSFWIVFINEYRMEMYFNKRLSLISNYKPLSLVIVICITLFSSDLIEKYFQCFDPFFTVWSVDYRLPMTALLMACICSALYLMLFCYDIWLEFSNMSFTNRRLKYRYKWILWWTRICAVTTVLAYNMAQLKEKRWHWYSKEGEPYNWTEVYLMIFYVIWNCYVVTLLVLYAPLNYINRSESSQLLPKNLQYFTSDMKNNFNVKN